MWAHRPAGHWLIIKWNGATSRVLQKPTMRWHAHLLGFQRTKMICNFFLSNVCGWFGIKLRFYKCEYMNVFACGHIISVQLQWWFRELLPPAYFNFRWNFVSIYSEWMAPIALPCSDKRTTNSTHQLDSSIHATHAVIRHTSFGNRIKATTGQSTSNFSVEFKTQLLPSLSLSRSHFRVVNYNFVPF